MKNTESLFERRTPEAAARQCATVLAWLTECDLATLEGLKLRKSTPKSELKRQTSICETAVRHCYELGVPPIGVRGEKCIRLDDALTDLAQAQTPR